MEEVIQIFVPDSSYDNDNLSSDQFREELRNKLEEFQRAEPSLKLRPLLQANIDSGADWPALLIEITPDIIKLSPIALFFLGKKIDENIDAWLSISRKVFNLCCHVISWPNRVTAFLFAMSNVQEKINIKSVTILQYETADGRFEQDWRQIQFDIKDYISDGVTEEFIGGQIHYFRLLVNDEEVRVLIRGNECELREADD